MSAISDLLLSLSEAGIVVFGSVLVALSVRVYLKNKSGSMLAMSIGFTILAITPLIEEILLDTLHFALIDAHIVQHSLTALGLLFLVYSIYGTRG